jgi:hypothetical protein
MIELDKWPDGKRTGGPHNIYHYGRLRTCKLDEPQDDVVSEE